ncbi:MAG: hypothetical protein EA362_06140 [Saprospirales bacterium]|nr:MAG: hypothetical protein EA362_06140 [Saprospirales bacterium]
MRLSKEENNKLLNAIPLIAAYVAFADGKLNEKEVFSAKRIAGLRRFSGNFEPRIRQYYNEVFEKFDDRFSDVVSKLPNDEGERNEYLEKELRDINTLLKKISPLYAEQLVHTYRSFAEHVAKAEGGIMQIGAVGHKEAKAMKLSMIEDVDSI